jgi:hypothetical protein
MTLPHPHRLHGPNSSTGAQRERRAPRVAGPTFRSRASDDWVSYVKVSHLGGCRQSQDSEADRTNNTAECAGAGGSGDQVKRFWIFDWFWKLEKIRHPKLETNSNDEKQTIPNGPVWDFGVRFWGSLRLFRISDIRISCFDMGHDSEISVQGVSCRTNEVVMTNRKGLSRAAVKKSSSQQQPQRCGWPPASLRRV